MLLYSEFNNIVSLKYMAAIHMNNVWSDHSLHSKKLGLKKEKHSLKYTEQLHHNLKSHMTNYLQYRNHPFYAFKAPGLNTT